MDRKLKERITGAALLVVLGVIFIPWLLDGRVDPVQSEQALSIPPPGSGATDRRTIVLDADRENTVPVATTPAPQPRPAPVASEPQRRESPPASPTVVPQPAPEPATVVAAVRDEPPVRAAPVTREAPPTVAPKPEPTPEPVRAVPKPARTLKPDPTAGWAVQVGSFASQANASKLADALVALEYKAFVSRKMLNGRVMYRVRVGPRATREEAVALSKRLKDDRQPVRVVEHPG